MSVDRRFGGSWTHQSKNLAGIPLQQGGVGASSSLTLGARNGSTEYALVSVTRWDRFRYGMYDISSGFWPKGRTIPGKNSNPTSSTIFKIWNKKCLGINRAKSITTSTDNQFWWPKSKSSSDIGHPPPRTRVRFCNFKFFNYGLPCHSAFVPFLAKTNVIRIRYLKT